MFTDPLWPSASVFPSFVSACLIPWLISRGSCCTVLLKMLKPQACDFTEKETVICKYHHPSVMLWLSHGESPGWFISTQTYRSTPQFTLFIPSKERVRSRHLCNSHLSPTRFENYKGQGWNGKKYLGMYDAYHMYQILSNYHQALKYFKNFNILPSKISILYWLSYMQSHVFLIPSFHLFGKQSKWFV